MAKQSKKLSMDIGISEADRKKIAEGLSALLADSYTLYLMTHNFHWNVTGPQFNSLHNMFMAQYTEQWNALDIIAERIRALGFPAPGTYKEFVKLASIKEVENLSRDAAAESQNVSAATEEQSASMEEIAASSQALAKLAEDLQTVVAKFRI